MENNSQNTRALKETGPENLSIPKLIAVAVFLMTCSFVYQWSPAILKDYHYQNFEPI